MSVSQSSSSLSDRTGQPVGDRSGRPGEHRSSEAQIRTLLDEQRQTVLAECHARINQHEFQAARAEEEQRLLQRQPLINKKNFELKKFKGFPEDVGYDDTALEDMPREAHRVHVYHSQQEGLSVGQSSSVSDRSGRPVVETVAKSHDRTGPG